MLSIVSLSAAALIAMACGSDSVGSAQLVEPADAGPIIVRPSDTFTVDSFVKAGWKKSREQDVSSLERAPSGWYGFFNKRDIELWVYETNGKLERYHQTLRRDVKQLPYDVPRQLELAIGEFVDFYNHRRYHKALKDITPADMLAGRRDEILDRRREAKGRTIDRRKLSNHILREQLKSA